MKKVVICIFTFIFLFTVSFVSADTKSKSEYFNVFNQEYEYENAPTLKIEAYFDDIPELSEMIREEYESLAFTVPIRYIKQLKEAGVVVYIVKSTTGYFSMRSDSAPNGFYNPTNKQIFINTSYDEEYDEYKHAVYRIGIALYHEFGHALDDLYGNCSRQKEFIEAFNEERDNDIMLGSTASEMFANVFENYMYDLFFIENYGLPLRSFSRYINETACPRCTAYIIKSLDLEDIYDQNVQIRVLIDAIFSCIAGKISSN